MLFTALLAALAAIPAVVAQDVSSSATRCTTRYGYYPLPTGTAAVPTWYKYTTTTNFFRITYTTRDTVTVTPSATTFTDVLTTTTTISTTTTSTPPASTVAAPAGFMPLLAANLPAPTQVSRVKRYALEGRDVDTALHLFKRQTAANSTGGYSVDRDGQSSDIYKNYPHEVRCRVSVTVNSTTTTIVTGLPETEVAPGPTARVLSTSTISTTTTITAVAPRRTEYAACGDNNVVSSVVGFTGEELVFYRIEYGDDSGFLIENKLIVNTTSPENCCIACQNTGYCAGSFFVPSKQECHLHLTQTPSLGPTGPAPYGNSSALGESVYPTEGIVALAPSGTAAVTPISTATADVSTCPAGSRSLYVGTIEGDIGFPIDIALVFSNGPCGYFSVWPIPVPEGVEANPDQFRKMRRALE